MIVPSSLRDELDTILKNSLALSGGGLVASKSVREAVIDTAVATLRWVSRTMYQTPSEYLRDVAETLERELT